MPTLHSQDKLVDELLAHAKLPPNPKVLDVGCGVGGTSIRLAKLIGATCTGVTLSTTQVAMAKQNAAEAGVTDRVRFFEMDGENITLPEDGTFDAVWISEALSHFPNKDRFFANAMRMLKPGGKLVLADWFRADHISAKLSNGVIKQIEKGMLLPRLDEVSVYVSLLTTSGLRLLWLEDVSKEVAKTWDLCLDLVMRPATWAFALSLGSHIFEFAKTFKAMQEGFGNGSFRYSLMVAEKPTVADLAE